MKKEFIFFLVILCLVNSVFGFSLVEVGIFTDYSLTLPYSVEVEGDYAYVTYPDDDTFVILDVSDKSNPVKIGSLQNKIKRPFDVIVSGDYAYVNGAYVPAISFYSAAVAIVDVSDKTNPVIISTAGQDVVTSFDAFEHSYVYNNDYLYVLEQRGLDDVPLLEIIDVSDKYNPTTEGIVDLGVFPISLEVNGDYVYIYMALLIGAGRR